MRLKRDPDGGGDCALGARECRTAGCQRYDEQVVQGSRLLSDHEATAAETQIARSNAALVLDLSVSYGECVQEIQCALVVFLSHLEMTSTIGEAAICSHSMEGATRNNLISSHLSGSHALADLTIALHLASRIRQ